MLDCNKTLTHVMRIYDGVNRTYNLEKEVIKNCSWFQTLKSDRNDSTAKKSEVTMIRIPLEGRNSLPNIKLQDIMIFGNVEVDGMSEAEILEKYNCCKVKNVTYNTNSSPYSQHIKIEGD